MEEGSAVKVDHWKARARLRQGSAAGSSVRTPCASTVNRPFHAISRTRALHRVCSLLEPIILRTSQPCLNSRKSQSIPSPV